MKTSEQLDKLSEALAAAQAEIENVPFNRINPFFKNPYADLAAVREACRLPLAKHGIAVIQSPTMQEGRLNLITRLMHKSGQWIENELALKPDKDNPQSVGSAISYGRRYALLALIGMVGEADDDGNEASGKNESPKSKEMSKEKEGIEIFTNTEEQKLKLVTFINAKLKTDKLPTMSGEDELFMINLMQGKHFDRQAILDVCMPHLRKQT